MQAILWTSHFAPPSVAGRHVAGFTRMIVAWMMLACGLTLPPPASCDPHAASANNLSPPQADEPRPAKFQPATRQDQQIDRATQLTAEAAALQAQWKESGFRSAINKYAEARSAWELAGNAREAIQTLMRIGDCYFMLSEFALALSHFNEAYAASQATGDVIGEVEALNGACRVLSFTEGDRQLLTTARRVLNRLQRRRAPLSAEFRRAEAEALCHLGEAYYLRGQLREALNFHDRALATWNALGDRQGQALAHLNRGHAFTDSGDLERATSEFQEALTLWQATGERRGIALTLTAIGGIHTRMSQHLQALDPHHQALEQFQTIGDRQSMVTALNNIAGAYEGLRDFPTALDYYRRALQISQDIRSLNSEAVIAVYLGRIYRLNNDTAQADKYLKHSQTLNRKLRKGRMAAYVLLELAELDQAASRRRQVLAKYRQVLQLYQRIGDRPGQAKTLNRLGGWFQAQGDWRRAEPYHRKALLLSQTVQDRSEEVESLYHLGRSAQARGQFDEALTHAEAARHLIESLRMGASGPALRAAYFASVRKHYELYTDLLMLKARWGKEFSAHAFQASESARARTLLDLLAEMKAGIRQGVDKNLLERERRLEQSLSAKGQYLIRLLSDGREAKQAQELREEMNRMSAEYNEVQARIRAQSPRYAALKQPQPLSLDEVQRQLPDDGTVLLEYFLGEEKSYLWAVTARGFTAHELPRRAQIEPLAREAYRLLTLRQSVSDLNFTEQQAKAVEADRQYWQCARRLSELLLGPVAAQLTGQRLLVVADGALHYLPFDALPLPSALNVKSPASQDQAEDFAPLLSRYEIVNLPSASTLASLRRVALPAKTVSKGIIVLADPVFSLDDSRMKNGSMLAARGSNQRAASADLHNPLRNATGVQEGGFPRLPGTRQEAEQIIAYAPSGRRTLVTGFAANRALAVSEALQPYQLIHFATHGVISAEQPQLSGLVLSLVNPQGKNEDGFLQLHDIYNLQLSAELVTLSACGTGLGKEVSGEGFVGLTHGFMHAGAKRLVTSLWKVDDQATAKLMQGFYRELLKEKKPPAAALRAAKLAMWRQNRWQPPFYWGAFTFQGDWAGGITLAPSPWRLWSKGGGIAISLLVLAACLYAFLRRKKRAATSGEKQKTNTRLP